MATPTYTLIDSVTLGSSASSVTFSGISATGKGDLVLIVEGLGATSFVDANVQLNSDSGSNYIYVRMLGNGSTATSASSASTTSLNAGYSFAGSTNRGMATIQIMDYSATDKHKSALLRVDNAAFASVAAAARWANTAAVTSVTILTPSDNYAAGSTFHLFQIVSE